MPALPRTGHRTLATCNPSTSGGARAIPPYVSTLPLVLDFDCDGQGDRADGLRQMA
jgi:hypothetical protein